MSHRGIEVAGTWKSHFCPVSCWRAGAGLDSTSNLVFKAPGIKVRRRGSRNERCVGRACGISSLGCHSLLGICASLNLAWKEQPSRRVLICIFMICGKTSKMAKPVGVSQKFPGDGDFLISILTLQFNEDTEPLSLLPQPETFHLSCYFFLCTRNLVQTSCSFAAIGALTQAGPDPSLLHFSVIF